MADEKKLERIYNVNLTKAYEYTRTRRALRTVKLLRAFLARNFRVELEDVKLSEPLNSYIWRDSIQKPPRHIKVKGVKENGIVHAFMHDEEATTAAKVANKKKKDDAKKVNASKIDAKTKAAQTPNAKKEKKLPVAKVQSSKKEEKKK